MLSLRAIWWAALLGALILWVGPLQAQLCRNEKGLFIDCENGCYYNDTICGTLLSNRVCGLLYYADCCGSQVAVYGYTGSTCTGYELRETPRWDRRVLATYLVPSKEGGFQLGFVQPVNCSGGSAHVSAQNR